MNILITGASKGIGAETAKLLALQGHSVMAVARDRDALEKLQRGILAEKNNAQIHIATLDLSEGDNAAFAEQYVRPVFPRLDALVNNAGKLISKPFTSITPDDLYSIYQVNVFSVFRLIQSLLPMMGQGISSTVTSVSGEGGGERMGERLGAKQVMAQAAGTHILNITSMGGITGTAKFAGLSAYSSSKGALSILTECLAVELKEKNISVNALAFGAVQTEMLSKAFPGLRAPLSAKQAAEFVADFVVNGQKYFNGKVLPVSLSTP